MSTFPTEPAWKSYLMAIIYLFPAFVVWIFSSVFLSSMLEKVWKAADLGDSKAHWLLDGAEFFINYGRLIILGIVLLFLALEYWAPFWPRYRRTVLMSIAFLCNAIVLAGMTSLCTSAILAAKVLMENR